jgi:hypothetical protein
MKLGPFLTDQPELPGVGKVGRYQSVAVFPLTDLPKARTACGHHQGVWFGYVPMDVVN